jgi:SAM-dependent methyltransferase
MNIIAKNGKSINCMLGTHFDEMIPAIKQINNFIAKHDTKCPHEIKSRPHGYFDQNRLWEYSMALAFTNPREGESALDAGSANTPLSWLLASWGLDVVTVNILQEAFEKEKANDEYFKYPNIKHICDNLVNLDFQEKFDYIYCMCVFEHVMERKRTEREKFANYWADNYIPTEEEVNEEETMLKNFAKALKPNGMLVISYDYVGANGHAAVLRSKQDILDRIVKVSGLSVYGGKVQTSPILSTRIGIVFLKK